MVLTSGHGKQIGFIHSHRFDPWVCGDGVFRPPPCHAESRSPSCGLPRDTDAFGIDRAGQQVAGGCVASQHRIDDERQVGPRRAHSPNGAQPPRRTHGWPGFHEREAEKASESRHLRARLRDRERSAGRAPEPIGHRARRTAVNAADSAGCRENGVIRLAVGRIECGRTPGSGQHVRRSTWPKTLSPRQ